MAKPKLSKAFTIAELTVVIAIVATLASIIGVIYVGVTARVRDNAVVSDANTIMTAQKAYAFNKNAIGKFWYSPNGTDSDLNVTLSSGNIANVVVNSTGYCIRVYNSSSSTYKDMASAYTLESVSGICALLPPATTPPIPDGTFIQTITSASCSTSRTRAVDARDSRTYWVQKLADGKCWMLTNLAYAGGGTNTYSDVRTLYNGASQPYDGTIPFYYIVPSTTNFTTEPTAPSTSVNGTGQYGYLYNFCSANGGQTGNSACSGTLSTPVNTAISACPAGWRLPTIGGVNEFLALNTAVNGGSTTSSAGLIATPWLGQYGGYWRSNFVGQGSLGYYWSSTEFGSSSAYNFYFDNASVATFTNANDRAFAVRCVAN